ncbi:MAG: molybdopterin-dependent oxidoreductase [Gammaproteobacteria bacterium]|nr:molybdopterin-dependent oxidoreductase [Gammaproteobacteria bacterium]
MGRRDVLKSLSALVLAMSGSLPLGGWAKAAAASAGKLLPGKVALKRLTERPPNYETPLEYFRSVLTPNEAFFVRYHHSSIPTIAANDYVLEVLGTGLTQPLQLGLEQLRNEFPATEVIAVCQCSGNRRGLMSPPVPGVQWGHGAMGNARWRGVRLADVLKRAGLKPSALEIGFDGADAPPLEGTPDFVKSLPPYKALHPDTLLAYEMNGEPLPVLNGYPLRLVVPGWTATYWIKHLTRIEALEAPSSSFWMAGGYRVPQGLFPVTERFATQETAERVPVTEIAVNSLVTSGAEDGAIIAGTTPLAGIAWDSGHGIDRVEISFDAGASWRRAELGPDLGRYSFREWRLHWPELPRGRHEAWARAFNAAGQSQVERAIPNPSGYQNNAYHRVSVEVRS